MANEFNYVKRGYDPAEVDAYIETMEAVIKSYKEKDTAIKNAILNAQIAADSIILNAKNQAKEIRSSALAQIADIRGSIAMQQEMLKAFQDEYNQMLGKYLHTVSNNDIGSVKSKINILEDYLEKFTQYDHDETAPAPESVPGMPLERRSTAVTTEEHEALLG